MSRVAVVGAGLGGLSAAAELALAGHEVDVWEAQSAPGGKAAQRWLGDYRFDTGPSLVTLPAVWDDLFARAGRRREDELPFTRLNPLQQAFWPEGERLSVPASPEVLAEEWDRRGWAPERVTRRWFDHARWLWERAGPLFLENSLHDLRTWTRGQTWSTLLNAGRLDAGRSYSSAVSEAFSHPKVRQFWERYATYNGSDPRRLPATFAMIPWVEFGLGGWAADRGIASIPTAMARLARDLGVTFHYETPVKALHHSGGVVTGLTIDDRGRPETLAFDAVVSNADVTPTYALLDRGRPLSARERRWADRYRRGEPSSSGVVFLWAMKGTSPDLGLHNLFFSSDYHAEFDALFGNRELPHDPTIYVNIGSKVTPSDAPEHAENWFVLINAPHDPGPEPRVDAPAVERLRETVLRRLESSLGSVRSRIQQELVLTPSDLERATGSPGGSLYGLASHRATAAFDRHPNRAPHFRGLYLCGGSAHPGGGMPLAVLSGRIAAGLCARDLRR